MLEKVWIATLLHSHSQMLQTQSQEIFLNEAINRKVKKNQFKARLWLWRLHTLTYCIFRWINICVSACLLQLLVVSIKCNSKSTLCCCIFRFFIFRLNFVSAYVTFSRKLDWMNRVSFMMKNQKRSYTFNFHSSSFSNASQFHFIYK